MQNDYTTNKTSLLKGAVDEESSSRQRTVGNLQGLPNGDLPELRELQEQYRLHGDVAPGSLDLSEELKALEAVKTLCDRHDIHEKDMKPCIAYIAIHGVSEQRRPYAFVLALNLQSLGLSQNSIKAVLENFSARLNKPLKQNEIASALKSGESGKYKIHRCDNPLLAAYCIGAVCPWKNIRGKDSKKPVISSLIASPWFTMLTPYAFKILCGLHRLRMLRGYPPKATLIFNYNQLANITGLSKNCFTRNLELLESFGLIADLKPGNGWGDGKKGSGTSLRFIWPLPKTHLSIHESADHDFPFKNEHLRNKNKTNRVSSKAGRGNNTTLSI